MFDPIELIWIDYLLGFILIILLPIYSLYTGPKSFHNLLITKSFKKQIYFGNSSVLWIGCIIILSVWFFTARNGRSIGFAQPDMSDCYIWCPLLIVFLILYTWEILNKTRSQEARLEARRHWLKYTPFMPQDREEAIQFLYVSVAAGFCEEIIFRFYITTVIFSFMVSFGGTIMQAIFISSLVFAISHAYQGVKSGVKIFFLALVFCLICYYTGSIIIPIFLHFLVDAVGGYLSYKMYPYTAYEEE
jgi:membrane protease YdiL (CAAX protease family)